MENTTQYETETCSRCGGSGSYSYCQMYGHTCFQCRGKGVCYSKRGIAALAYARELRTVTVDGVQPGWLIWMEDPCFGSHKAAWYEIESIGEDGSKWMDKASGEWKPYICITTRVGGMCTFPNAQIQAIPTKERIAEIKALALAYQSTLSRQGKPLKGKVAA